MVTLSIERRGPPIFDLTANASPGRLPEVSSWIFDLHPPRACRQWLRPAHRLCLVVWYRQTGARVDRRAPGRDRRYRPRRAGVAHYHAAPSAGGGTRRRRRGSCRDLLRDSAQLTGDLALVHVNLLRITV